MTKLKDLLTKLGNRLVNQKVRRRVALNRMHSRLHGAEKAKLTARKLEAKAKRLHREWQVLLETNFEPGHESALAARKRRREERLHKRAAQYRVKAAKETARADAHKAAIRKYTQRIERLNLDVHKVEAEIEKLKPVVHLDQQKVTGGNFRERWILSLNTSWRRWQEGIRAGRYSMEGVAVLLPFGPGPWEGRDDCSSFLRSHCQATGADDPSGHNFSPEGWTGDMAEAHGRWKQVSKAEMMAAGQGFIIYGSGPGHHTEGFAPLKAEPERTIGHGDEACNPGTIHLFGPGEVERYYIFVN